MTDRTVEHDHALSKKTRENVIGAFAPPLRASARRVKLEISQECFRRMDTHTHTPFVRQRSGLNHLQWALTSVNERK